MNSDIVRTSIFLGVLLSFALLEWRFPRRKKRVATTSKRWVTNIGLVSLNTLLLKLVFPVTLVEVAKMEYSGGLLGLVHIPIWSKVVLSVIALDLLVYIQHLLFHKIPILWRLHMVHHTDLDLDASSGVRFHTIEIGLSFLLKLGAVVVLGVPVLGVIIFEILLNATAVFNHSNLYIPPSIERILRLFLVTPDMHRIHHSSNPKETDQNYGFSLPWWDRVFGTYTPQPELGHDNMIIGLNAFRIESKLKLPGLLVLPFKREKTHV
ncbi:MAG: sterol desaturase family protein [Candidatus Margulisbacteria bacterium]|nr:sterol desaturase family protein [Candidatus Margulisiibacteriota bacterium]